MKQLIAISVLMVTFGVSLQAQSTHDFLISGAMDLIKTDNQKLFDKAQIGVEANYFIQRKFAAGIGAELWTKQKNSFVLGVRWYPADNFFVRFRGLIGVNDAAIGAGWSKPLNESWRFEAIGDFYFDSHVAVRTGVSYIIK